MYEGSLGIVLRSADYKDYDRMLTVFTKDKGKVSALARGSRKQGSPLLPISELFCCAEYSFYKTKTRCSINQAEIRKSFFNIRGDVVALTVASIMSDICDKAVMEEQPNPMLFALLASALYCLDKGCDPCGVIIFFTFKALDILGLRPHLDSCVVCGDKAEDKVNISLGGAVCAHHEGEKVKRSTLAAISRIFHVPSKNMENELPPADDELLSLAERWLTYSLEYQSKGFKLLHSMIAY